MTKEKKEIRRRAKEMWIEREAERLHGQRVVACRRANGYGVGADMAKIAAVQAHPKGTHPVEW